MRQEELDKLSKLDFKKRDSYLDATKNGNHYLKSPIFAKIVADSLHFWDNKRLELICYCIMSNHVHTVFRLFDEQEAEGKKIYLEDIMHSIKLFSTRECNKVLGKEGQFWHNESYDRMVRDRNELYRIINYVLDNPVKAGLCEKRADWQWSYIKSDYNEFT